MNTLLKVQYGCGRCAPEGWENFDSSPSLFLQRLPVVGRFFRGEKFPDFPETVRRASIINGLPIRDNSADVVYCSHVLEHLALNEFRFALRETYRMLKPGGIFRFALPDLELLIKTYTQSTDPMRAMHFMEHTILGRKERSRSLAHFIRDWLGGSRHLWMWDFESIRVELADVGFTEIRRAVMGDSETGIFSEVEEARRWNNNLGVHCFKPSE